MSTRSCFECDGREQQPTGDYICGPHAIAAPEDSLNLETKTNCPAQTRGHHSHIGSLKARCGKTTINTRIKALRRASRRGASTSVMEAIESSIDPLKTLETFEDGKIRDAVESSRTTEYGEVMGPQHHTQQIQGYYHEPVPQALHHGEFPASQQFRGHYSLGSQAASRGPYSPLSSPFSQSTLGPGQSFVPSQQQPTDCLAGPSNSGHYGASVIARANYGYPPSPQIPPYDPKPPWEGSTTHPQSQQSPPGSQFQAGHNDRQLPDFQTMFGGYRSRDWR